MQKGSENMNKIFKVIWSKTRNCYVVASELAKGRTKAASTGDKAKRLALAAITALMLLPVGGYSYAADAADTTKVEPASGTSTATVEVYTKAGADDTFVKKGSDNGDSLTIGASKSETYSTHQYVTGAQTTYDGLNGKVVTQATGGESSISLKVGNSGDLTYNFQNYSEVTTTKDKGTTFTYYYEDGAQTIDNNTTIKGNTVTTGSVTASNGVVDETTTEGVSVKKTNTVGQNLNALDQAMKDEKTSTALHISNSGDLIVGTKENQTVKDMEIRGKLTSGSLSTGNITATGDVTVTGKMAADGVTDETTKDGTYIKQNNTVGNNLVSLNTQVKANADAINEEAQKRKYSVTNLEKADAAEAATREAKDNELNERITNEANAIHDEIKAGDEKLDTRITNVKEYLEKQTSDTYVSKDDAAVQDGAIVKADKTIGENVTNLDAALAKETADRLGADKAQDKVIEQVNQNMVDGFNTINKNMADGFTALNQADANELAGRMAADTKLVEAVNSGLSLSNDNVLQKNTTTIDAQGNVTTSKTDANEMILNKGKDNQITLNKNGIKVGTNSTVVDKDGVYTGGDTYSEAKAAMSANGKIKGANGAFTVDENGNVTSKATITGETVTDGKGASMSNGTVTGKTLTDGIATISNGNVNTSGSITGGTVTSTGNISALGDIHAGGAITGASASIQGALTAGSATITGDLTAGGAIQGKSISDGTATMQNGNLTGVKNLSAETITTSGNATIGGDLTVNGKLNVDEIDLTKSGIVGDNNVTASTKDGSEKESAIDYDENGTSTWAKSTDADGNWNKSTLTVEGNDVTSKVIDSEKNSNLSTQTSTQSQSTLKDKDSNTNTATQSATESSSVLQDKEGKTSTFQQRVDEILNQINSSDTVFSKVDQKVDNITSEVKNGDNATSTTQSATDITNTAKQGTITNEAQKLVNKASDTISNEAANNITNTSTNGNIANTATNGTISNNAKELTNTASENITNKAENGNISNIASNGTISNEAKTISNKADEALTNDAKTITNTASESVTTQIGDGSTVQSVMNESGIANKATGKSITNDAATITNTGTTSVTNQVGNNKVLVDTTHVQSAFGDTIYTTWDESGITNNATDKTVTTNAKDILNTATGDITNSATNGTITNTAKDLVNTASENMTNNVGKDLTTTVGGKQTTTVTGDSSLTAENINNTAKNKITNKAIDVETDASSSIVNKVSNDAGSNTSTQLSYETKEEMSQADGKTASYLRGAAEEKSQLTDVDKKTTIDTIAGQTNTNITDGTNTSNDLQKADQIASSVTDGTNTTVVNQDAKSLASSITDGTKANNTNNTVDKSEQLIKANDTQYSATTKTATKMEDALVSGSNIIDVIKGLDAAGNPLISSAVTDGTTITGISQNAKDINLSAAGGTITNDAQNITNKAAETLSNSAKNIANTTTEDMTNTIGKNLKTTVGGDMSTEVTGSQSTTVKGNQSNTVEGTLTETVTGKATENYNGGLETTITGKEKHTVNGDQTNTITGKQATTVTGDSSLSAQNITNTASEKITNQIGDGSAVKSEMTADGITNTAEGGTIYNKSKDILNEASGDILNFADGEIGNVATKITNITGDNTVTSDTNGTTFENKAHNTAIKEGTVTKTTISGNTIETGQATMDYAEVMKDLGVHGNATVDQKLTVKGDSDLQGNANVGKNLTVNGTSDLKGNVTMESNATVQKDLTVNGTTTTNKLVVNNGATIKGGTTTDTLHVTSTSTFDGTATFKDIVTMEKTSALLAA